MCATVPSTTSASESATAGPPTTATAQPVCDGTKPRSLAAFVLPGALSQQPRPIQVRLYTGYIAQGQQSPFFFRLLPSGMESSPDSPLVIHFQSSSFRNEICSCILILLFLVSFCSTLIATLSIYVSSIILCKCHAYSLALSIPVDFSRLPIFLNSISPF